MADSTDQYEAGAMIRRAIDVLCDEFSGIFSPESVDRYVMESFESLKRSRVQTFVPLFTTRFARDRLRALGQAHGLMGKASPRGPLRVRPQRRTIAHGSRPAAPSCGRNRSCALGRFDSCRSNKPHRSGRDGGVGSTYPMNFQSH
jgi:hypothetical protein